MEGGVGTLHPVDFGCVDPDMKVMVGHVPHHNRQVLATVQLWHAASRNLEYSAQG